VSGGGVPIQAPNPIGVTFESLNLFQLHRSQSPLLSAYTANTDPFLPLCYFQLSRLHATRQRKLVKMILTNRQKQINWAAAIHLALNAWEK